MEAFHEDGRTVQLEEWNGMQLELLKEWDIRDENPDVRFQNDVVLGWGKIFGLIARVVCRSKGVPLEVYSGVTDKFENIIARKMEILRRIVGVFRSNDVSLGSIAEEIQKRIEFDDVLDPKTNEVIATRAKVYVPEVTMDGILNWRVKPDTAEYPVKKASMVA
ncbi:hypothetical protein KJ652_04630 [Patescibacteria group bacterium]|nr:hypothetical protein [Patescibacteria group bacterium]MBU1123851.1 hypothetical protein [Patescibacteria group bacterium]